MRQKKEKSESKRYKKWIPAVIIAVICLALAGGGTVFYLAGQREAAEAAAMKAAEDQKLAGEAAAIQNKEQKQEDEVSGYLAESGLHVFDAIKKRPPLLDLTEENQADFVKIESCLIDNETSKIVIKTKADALPISDDKHYYLFAMKSYEDGITEEMSSLVSEYKDLDTEFRLARHFTGTESGVFYKFVVAVLKGGKYEAVSSPHYITNPEAVSKYKSNGAKAASKKGLLIDPNKLRTTELDDLSVKQAAYNIPLSRILGPSTGGTYATINYSYNGKNYAFNGEVMSEYDLVFSTLTNKGMEITAIILNDIASAYPQLIHPLARSGLGSAPYYAFNGTDASGTEYLAAVGAFLAERYSGRANGRGLVANWVIGNEINARKEWNYMQYVGLEEYVQEYAKAYRVFYNAIKSINSACNIYISLDQQWNRNISGSQNYDSRDILDEFNKLIKKEGNIDWGLAIHPYNVPLTAVPAWATSKYVKNSADTPMVSMANINIVTDYLQQEEFLQEDGKVRSITLSELGYTSSKGEELQAAALVYAYKVAEANQHIDAILFSRQTDALEEIAQGLAFGLDHPDGSHKYAWNIYRYMDSDKQQEYTDFAKGIIGISSWDEMIKNY